MAKNPRQAVLGGIDLITPALIPYVEARLKSALKDHWKASVMGQFGLRARKDGTILWDLPGLLKAIGDNYWNKTFKNELEAKHRNYARELLEVRNRHAHDGAFSYDEARRALDTMRLLMEGIGEGEVAQKLATMGDELPRTEDGSAGEGDQQTKTGDGAADSTGFSDKPDDKEKHEEPPTNGSTRGLLPWREVVEPHDEVADGTFEQAEFAADLRTVIDGSAPSGYRDPQKFYSRTHLTGGLSTLLVGAARRLSAQGGDPVVELQTNFGGGKTHSMLALYHMAGDTRPEALPGLNDLLREEGLTTPGKVNRAVVVGTARGPIDGFAAVDGRKINTIWGDLAQQLGGQDAYQRVAEHDAKGLAPGSSLLAGIFHDYAPCLILIDEWVAYLRQIYKVDGLPAGSFDANLSFVQSLTEAVKASPSTLLVASLPEAETEAGGEGGQEALARLKQTFARVKASWRPASAEESYEIARLRLFKPIDDDKKRHRGDAVEKFAKLYRGKHKKKWFPQQCAEMDYERKLKKAYPVHPELFDQLFLTWGASENFQRTRGVLRLMAQVVHALWVRKDESVLIMPADVPLTSNQVKPGIMDCFEDSNWESILSKDVDGEISTPHEIDKSKTVLGRYAAAQRVARCVFIGSAPIHRQQNVGLDERQINLGVAQPGEGIAHYRDALGHLSDQATYMHNDHGLYRYSVSPNLNRLAADRAAQLPEADILDRIEEELNGHRRRSDRERGHFSATQLAPPDSADIPDEKGGIRAVILGVAHPHSSSDPKALEEAKKILMNRGDIRRVYLNTLVFIAADARQIKDLKDSVRKFLTWKQIVADARDLDLTQSNKERAEKRYRESEETARTRLIECWRYLLYPKQDIGEGDVGSNPAIEWAAEKITPQDKQLFASASEKLEGEQALVPVLGPTSLDKYLPTYLWHAKSHLQLGDLWDWLNKYPYLPRLKNKDVLVRAIQKAVANDVPGPFAYAESWDEEANTYHGLIIDRTPSALIAINKDSVLVRPEVAETHRPLPKKEDQPSTPSGLTSPPEGAAPDPRVHGPKPEPPKEPKPKRFRGKVEVSTDRPYPQIQRIIEDVVGLLTATAGCAVKVTLEIDAEVTKGEGFERSTAAALRENANTLGFFDTSIE